MRDEVVDPDGSRWVPVGAEGIEESHTVEPHENPPYSTLNILAVARWGRVYTAKPTSLIKLLREVAETAWRGY